MSVSIDKDELKQKIAKQFTDSHTPWPELTPIDWPDTFADKIMLLVNAQQNTLLDKLEAQAEDYEDGDEGIPGYPEPVWVKAVPISAIDQLRQELR